MLEKKSFFKKINGFFKKVGKSKQSIMKTKAFLVAITAKKRNKNKKVDQLQSFFISLKMVSREVIVLLSILSLSK